MTFQSAPNCAEAVIQASFGGVNLANVINFRKLSGYNQDDIDLLATTVDEQVGAHYRTFLSADVTYNGTLVRGLQDELDFTSFDPTHAGVGGLTDDSLPANVTLCATLRTGLTGRSARGRFYMLPTVVTQMTTPNTFASAVGTALALFLNDLKDATFAVSWDMVIVSRFNAGVKRGTAIANKVTSIEVRNLLSDSQRGRLPAGH
jgi:hypothetical protein